jgi:hypothetical protein
MELRRPRAWWFLLLPLLVVAVAAPEFGGGSDLVQRSPRTNLYFFFFWGFFLQNVRAYVFCVLMLDIMKYVCISKKNLAHHLIYYDKTAAAVTDKIMYM